MTQPVTGARRPLQRPGRGRGRLGSDSPDARRRPSCSDRDRPGDGRPHATPLVGVWLDDAIFFATGLGEQKAVNLRTNQNVFLMTGCNEWERGVDVVVEGEAVQVVDESVLKRLTEAWETKWDGRWHYEVHEGGFRHEGNADAILVFSVKPTKVLVFAKGTFGQTRHRFKQE